MVKASAGFRSLSSFHPLPQPASSCTRTTMRSLTVDSLNPAVRNVQYAVRGELAIKAEEYRVRLKERSQDSGLPFDRVISSNIGNPQQKGLDQPPITFNRQVAALMEWPQLAQLAPDAFPKDVIARAKELHEEIGSIGAYSHSQGVPLIRQNVAKFIQDRDGHPSLPDNIFLTGGASAGVSLLISMLISEPHKSGVLIPIPQYPLYTATLAQFSGVAIPYHLDEVHDWSTSIDEIKAALKKAKEDGIDPKALDTQREVANLCAEHGLVLLADEVYQSNLHRAAEFPFTSFKKVVCDIGSPVPLVSFHSISKGVTGECGRRGGYFECHNISEDVRAMMYKMVSVGLCPPLQGQIGMDCLVRPPKQGDESYALWKEETTRIHEVLAQRTKVMADRLNSLPGVSCVDSPGALYLYPKITLSDKAITAAQAAGKEPDAFYSLALLDATGICVVPGSGFGQKEGEYHYRLTCLCPGVDEYVGKLEKFHREFTVKYQ
ncbi:pyridoxal phosphate-dependent transferase [Suillus paluster]|uniref:pyridoxal phosphate-dependent transferase n=1 Tax=Suillus paluster TaxID=48578 RepID=UPI001B8751F2|nr:pyridoxal phosphate-dependent transferase [Suillus paluster]KAG1743733.1 pyridoxal phosphate-dependent transferase [Suillus paluster]